MRHHAGTLLRTIATGLVLLAERVDPQVKPPGAFTVHNRSGTTTYEPRLIWLGRIEDTA